MSEYKTFLRIKKAAVLNAAAYFALFVPTALAASTEYDIAGDHMEKKGGLPQLNPDHYASQVFWLFVAFIILYVAFSRRILPNISEVLERRRETISSDLETAESLREEAESVQKEYEDAIAKAQSEGHVLLQELQGKISVEMDKEFQSFKENSQGEVDKAQEKAAVMKQKLMSDLQDSLPELTSIIVEKLTGIETSEKEAQAAVSSHVDKKAKAA